MHDSFVIFHENIIEADHVFWVIVAYHPEVSEFPLENFLASNEIGDLDIYSFRPVFRYEIDFAVSDVSDIHGVSVHPQVVVYDIFQFPPSSDVVARREIVVEGKIVEVVFLLSFEYFFPFEVVALAGMDDVGLLQVLKVIPYGHGVGIDMDSLQFFYDRIEREEVSDITRQIRKQFFQEIYVLYPVTFHYVLQDNRVFQGFQEIQPAFVVGHLVKFGNSRAF